jgi:hypothetical protein
MSGINSGADVILKLLRSPGIDSKESIPSQPMYYYYNVLPDPCEEFY